MERYAELLTHFIDKTGAPGAIIAALVVGLALAVILYAKTHDLFAAARTADQKGDLLDHFTVEVDRLAAAEMKLREELSRSDAEQNRLRDKQRALETKVELMRAALRRAIDLLRAVREGRLAPDAIEAIDTIETGL